MLRRIRANACGFGGAELKAFSAEMAEGTRNADRELLKRILEQALKTP